VCYSAMVEQHLRTLAREFRAEVDWGSFEQLLGRRLVERDVKVARALEDNFSGAPGPEPASEVERLARLHVETFRRETAERLEQEIFKQRKRLAEAQRSLASAQTRRALEDERISRAKIEAALGRLADLRRTEPLDRDRRIFPLYHVAVIVEEDGCRLVRPMRYTCRLPGKPPSYDARYPGTYNARRDHLRGFWAPLYGKSHAIMAISSFFENVRSRRAGHSDSRDGERPRSVVLQFNPHPPTEMLVACLWARWTGKDAPELLSFAAITDEPPPEVAAAGHNRCVIPLKRENLDEWLAPGRVSLERLDAILTDRQRPYFEHRIAA
jgi:putative SOS response-associated peptidase YedK